MELVPRSLAIGLLAMLPGMASGQSLAQSIRSVADTRPRPSDEHDRPYFRETQSHRGWEIRTPRFTVFADTSREDARLAAGHVEQAWQSASDMARRWTDIPDAPDFGLNALQVVITDQPVRDRDAPATTLNVVGIQTQVEVTVAPGQPPLAQQLVRLREGAAYGMLHAAGLDAYSPSWITAGIAAVAGRSGLTAEEKAAAAAPDQLPPFGGEQWRYGRSQADRLAYSTADHEEAASKAAFLLTGNDGEHAPSLFALIARAQEVAVNTATSSRGFGERGHSAGAFEQFFAERRAGYAAWKEHPESGQPIFEVGQEVLPETLAAQREMIVLLKLLRRYSEPLAGERSNTTKISELGKDGRTVARRAGSSGLSLSFPELAERLVDPARPTWATLDASGQLLLSTDTKRVQQLLWPQGASYELQARDGKAVLVRHAENGPTVSAWLEENPRDKSRLVAKFATRSANSKVRVNEYQPRESAAHPQRANAAGTYR